MEPGWKRPKTIPSKTEHITTNCGTLHLTIGYDNDKIVEVKGMIGKNGTCANSQLDMICKLISMYLQSPEPRYKICKKFRKQFTYEGDNKDLGCGQDKFWHEKKEYFGCGDYISQRVISELGE